MPRETNLRVAELLQQAARLLLEPDEPPPAESEPVPKAAEALPTSPPLPADPQPGASERDELDRERRRTHGRLVFACRTAQRWAAGAVAGSDMERAGHAAGLLLEMLADEACDLVEIEQLAVENQILRVVDNQTVPMPELPAEPTDEELRRAHKNDQLIMLTKARLAAGRAGKLEARHSAALGGWGSPDESLRGSLGQLSG